MTLFYDFPGILKAYITIVSFFVSATNCLRVKIVMHWLSISSLILFTPVYSSTNLWIAWSKNFLVWNFHILLNLVNVLTAMSRVKTVKSFIIFLSSYTFTHHFLETIGNNVLEWWFGEIWSIKGHQVWKKSIYIRCVSIAALYFWRISLPFLQCDSLLDFRLY